MNDLSSIIRQLEGQKSAIERALSALREASGMSESRLSSADRTPPPKKPRKHRLSAEGRERIAEAARRRWAAKRATKESRQSTAKKASARKKQAKQARAATA